MNYKKFLIFLTAILFSIIYLTSIPANAYVIGQANPSNKNVLTGPVGLSKQIIILNDPENEEFSSASASIFNSIHSVYTSITIKNVRSLNDINMVLSTSKDTFILIWSFNTTLSGIIFTSGEVIPWKGLAILIEATPKINHIFNTGNSEALDSAISLTSIVKPVNYYVQPAFAGVVDLELSFLFTLWTVSTIFSNIKDAGSETKTYNLVGETLKTITLKFFSNNVNDLAQSNINPKYPAGEEDKTIKQAILDNFTKTHPNKVLGLAKFDPVKKNVPVYFKGNNINDVNGIASDILLAVLPNQSGLTGPIGFVLDFLFQTMLGDGYNQIKISNETISLIADLFHVITDLVGGKGIDESASNALKDLVKLLAKEFPFGDELVPYINLIIDGLFALKGGPSTIIAFIGKVINTLLPQLPDIVKIAINTTIDVSTSLVNSLSSGEEFLPALGEALSSNLMGLFINKLLNETLHVSVGQVAGYTNKILTVGKTIIDMLSGNKDIVQVLEENFPTILSTLLGLTSPSIQQYASQLGDVIGFGLSLLNMDKSKLLDKAKSLFNSLFPDTISITIGTTTYNKNSLIEKVSNEIVTITGQIKEAGTTDPSQIISALNGTWSEIKPAFTNQNLYEILRNATLWAASFIQDKLSNTQRLAFPDALDMLNGFLTYLSSPPINAINATIVAKIKSIGQSVLSVIGLVSNAPTQIKQLIAKTEDQFNNLFTDPVGTITPVLNLIFGNNNTIISSYTSQLQSFASLAFGIYRILGGAQLNSFQGIMQLVFALAGTGVFKNFGVDITPIVQIFQALLPDVLQVANAPTAFEATQDIMNYLNSHYASASWYSGMNGLQSILNTGLNLLLSAREIFQNGIQWLFGQIVSWLGNQVDQLVNQLLNSLVGLIPGSAAVDNNLAHDFGSNQLVMVNNKPMEQAVGINGTVMQSGILSHHGDLSKITAGDLGTALINTSISPNFGGFSAFEIGIFVGLKLNFGFDSEGFKQLLVDVIFKGKDLFQGGIGGFFSRLFSFFSISPVITAKLTIGSMSSGKNSFFNFLLQTLGLKLDFSGGGWFAMNLLTFAGGQLQFQNFLKIIEWGFQFTITLSKELTLLDFLSAGVGGGILNTLADYLGLGGIKVIIAFTLFLEVVKRAAEPGKPEESTFTMKIDIGATILLELSLFIVGIKLWGSLDIILTFFQDLAAGTGLQVFLDVIAKFGIALEFLFTSFGAEATFHLFHKELTSHDPTEQKDNGAKGFDKDGDGLGDEYEAGVPGLDPNKFDTDGDGLSDKYEMQISHTDPTKIDTDGDGLSDGYEINTSHTDPLNKDSDWDGVSDYDEVMIYHTNPNLRDTDGDGLDDHFEITHSWNISTIVPSVKDVVIGGIHYNDHTDPLNPDTDGDGLLDGQEG